MSEIISITIQFFIIIGLGAAVRPFIESDRWIEVLNKYGLYIGFPAIIFSSLIKLKDNLNFDFTIILANTFIILISIGFVLLISRFTKLSRDVKNTYVICTVFGNVAYLGFPFITALFPDSNSLVSIIVAIYIFIIFTVGVLILDISKKEKSVKINVLFINLLKNPLLVSVLAGITFAVLQITIPPVIRTPIEMLASSGSPIVLFSLGIFISRKIQLNSNLFHAAAISVYKLIVLPVIFFLFLQLFQITRSQASISIIESAMPLAITPFALAEVYPLDKEIVAMTIMISTIFSLFTLVVVSFLVK